MMAVVEEEKLLNEINSNNSIASVETETVESASISMGKLVENDTLPPNQTLPIDMQFNDGHIVSISVYSVLFVISAIGNLTVLIAILRRKRPSGSLSRIDFLLLHLAIADLMVTLFMMPLEIGWAATVYWRAGDLMCRIMSFFRIFGLFLSGFVLVCLAVDRYLAVRFPMQGLASTKRAKIMVSAAWLLSTVCSFPQALIFHVEAHPDFPWYTQCVTFNYFTSPELELAYKVFGMVMMYALPFIMLVVLYGSIARQLYTMSHSSSAFGVPDGSRRPGAENIERAKVKSIQMTFVITAVFFMCWTPYYAMCIWYWIDPETAKAVDQRIQKGLFLFASTNSAFDPLVYGVFNIKSLFGRNTTQTRDGRMGGHYSASSGYMNYRSGRGDGNGSPVLLQQRHPQKGKNANTITITHEVCRQNTVRVGVKMNDNQIPLIQNGGSVIRKPLDCCEEIKNGNGIANSRV